MIKYYVACFYSFEESVIFKGFVDSDKNLVVEPPLVLQNCSVEKVSLVLERIGVKPWISQSEMLSTALNNKCEQFSFALENQEAVEDLQNLFKGMKAENKIKCDEPIKGEAKIKAFQLLLRACKDELLKKPLRYVEGLGDTRPRRYGYGSFYFGR